MSRRSRKKQSSPVPAILGGAVLIAMIAIGYSFLPKGGSATAKPLPLEVYVDSCNSLRGSEYSVSGEILENYHHDPEVGKFIFLTVDEEEASSESPKNIGILVPTDVSGPNLETKQQYHFVVQVQKEGMLVATSYTSK